MYSPHFIRISSDSRHYPDQKTNDFRVKLPKNLTFEGENLCALHSISYPHSWFSANLQGKAYIEVKLKNLNLPLIRIPIEKGLFDDHKGMLKYLNKEINDGLDTYVDTVYKWKIDKDRKHDHKKQVLLSRGWKEEGIEDYLKSEGLSRDRRSVDELLLDGLDELIDDFDNLKLSEELSKLEKEPQELSKVDEKIDSSKIEPKQRKKRQARKTVVATTRPLQEMRDEAKKAQTQPSTTTAEPVVTMTIPTVTTPFKTVTIPEIGPSYDPPVTMAIPKITPTFKTVTIPPGTTYEAPPPPPPPPLTPEPPVTVKKQDPKPPQPPPIVTTEAPVTMTIPTIKTTFTPVSIPEYGPSYTTPVTTTIPPPVTPAFRPVTIPATGSTGETPKPKKITPKIVKLSDMRKNLSYAQLFDDLHFHDPHVESKREVRFGDLILTKDPPPVSIEPTTEYVELTKPRRHERSQKLVKPSFLIQRDLHLLEEIRDELLNSKIEFSGETRVKTTFNTSKILYITLSKELGYLTGYNAFQQIQNGDEAQFHPDVKNSLHGFIIYERNGLLQNTIFGDVMAPVLQHVTVRGNHGDIIYEAFDNYTWVPVQANDIGELHFQIETTYGDPMPFEWGSIYMVLVFKRKFGA